MAKVALLKGIKNNLLALLKLRCSLHLLCFCYVSVPATVVAWGNMFSGCPSVCIHSYHSYECNISSTLWKKLLTPHSVIWFWCSEVKVHLDLSVHTMLVNMEPGPFFSISYVKLTAVLHKQRYIFKMVTCSFKYYSSHNRIMSHILHESSRSLKAGSYT